MTSTRPPYAFAFALVLACVLCGCATYKKCGFSGCPGDAQITAEVQALFAKHPALQPPILIRIQTLDHVVYLYGLVDTGREQILAADVAREAPGVVRVVNSIAVRGNVY